MKSDNFSQQNPAGQFKKAAISIMSWLQLSPPTRLRVDCSCKQVEEPNVARGNEKATCERERVKGSKIKQCGRERAQV